MSSMCGKRIKYLINAFTMFTVVPWCMLRQSSGRSSGAINSSFPSTGPSPLAAVLIMYAYHLGEKASRQTTSADVSVAQGSKAKFGESGLYDKRRQRRDFHPPQPCLRLRNTCQGAQPSVAVRAEALHYRDLDILTLHSSLQYTTPHRP